MPPNAPPPSPGRPGEPWAYHPNPGYRPDFKPGIVALRPLSVGEILDGGFATIRRYPRVVFGFAAILAVVLEVARVITGLAFGDVRGSLNSPLVTTGTGPVRAIHLTTVGVASTIVEYALTAVLGALLAGVVTSLVGKAIIGQPVDGGQVVRAVMRRFWPLLLVSLIAGLVPYLPAVLIVVAVLVGAATSTATLAVGLLITIPATIALGVYLWGKLALAVPAFVLERLGAGRAVSRSWRLVRGAFWRVWGLRALVTLIVAVASSVMSVPFLFASGLFGGFGAITAGGERPLGAVIVITVGTAVIWTLTQPLLAAAATLIYVDRRMRAEALDIQLTEAALAHTSEPVAGPRP